MAKTLIGQLIFRMRTEGLGEAGHADAYVTIFVTANSDGQSAVWRLLGDMEV